MSIPAKIQRGANVKEATFNKINQIIDYLKSQRLNGDLKTIKITQNTSGISISALPQNATAKGGKSESFDYPFKMSILSEDQKNYLLIKDGRIQINDSFQDRCYIENFKIELNQLKNDGDYAVILLLSFNPLYDGGAVNPIFTPYIYFADAGSLTSNVPQTRGIFTIPLGKITKETVEETVNLSVENAIIGNFVIDYISVRHPFSISAKVKNLTLGQLKNEWSLSDFSYFVDKGTVKISDELINVSESNFNISSDTVIYCQVNENEKTALLVKGDLSFYDSGNKIYNFPVAKVMNNNGIYIEQYINSLIYGNADTYKVKTINQDQLPDFLFNKFVFNSNDQTKFPSESLIGAEKIENKNSESGLISYKIKPYWMYQNISGFNKEKQQNLVNNKGSLVWKKSDDDQLKFMGSLDNYFQIHENENGKFIRWKNQFSVADGIYYFVMQNQNGNFQIFTFGKDGNKNQGVLIWDFQNGKQGVIQPPAKTDDIENYVLTGTFETGLNWEKYIDIEDIYKVKVNKDDGFAGFLQDKIISEFNSILINSFDVPNPENESETGHYLTLDINPDTFISSDKSINIEATEDDKIDFKGGKVKCTDNDSPAWLNDKISVDDSISDLIKLDKQENQILIKSKLQGSGLLILENGKIKKLTAPEGNVVLTCNNGSFGWMQYDTCKNSEG